MLSPSDLGVWEMILLFLACIELIVVGVKGGFPSNREAYLVEVASNPTLPVLAEV